MSEDPSASTKVSDLERIADKLGGLSDVNLLPIERAITGRHIDPTQYRRPVKFTKRIVVDVEADNASDYNYRLLKIERFWGSRSNFISAMFWLFTQDIIDNKTIGKLRALWDASALPGELHEYSHDALVRRLEDKSFWESKIDTKDADKLTQNGRKYLKKLKDGRKKTKRKKEGTSVSEKSIEALRRRLAKKRPL